MNLDRFLGAVAEEVGSSVADEVRGYFRIGMLIVVLVVFVLGVLLAAWVVTARTPEEILADAASDGASGSVFERPPADTQQLVEDGWGAEAVVGSAPAPR